MKTLVCIVEMCNNTHNISVSMPDNLDENSLAYIGANIVFAMMQHGMGFNHMVEYLEKCDQAAEDYLIPPPVVIMSRGTG